MNQLKKKICAGYDGIEHEAYIYKNIGGKKYCKSCTLKLEPPIPIKKISEKRVFRIILKKNLLEEDKSFYMSVWKERFFRPNFPDIMKEYPRCEVCKTFLGQEPLLTYFHHILEKRNYPALRRIKRNIAIVCPECHSRYETYPDKVPYLVEKREQLKAYYERLGQFIN